MLLVLVAMVAAVFWVTWLLMDGVGWAVAVSAMVLVAGAVVGRSTDID